MLPENFENMTADEQLQAYVDLASKTNGGLNITRGYAQHTTPVVSPFFPGGKTRLPKQFVTSEGEPDINELARYYKDEQAFSSPLKTFMSNIHSWDDLIRSIGSLAKYTWQVDPGQVPDENEILKMVADTLRFSEHGQSQMDAIIDSTSQNNLPTIDYLESLFETNKPK
jgi:hypothetical protein